MLSFKEGKIQIFRTLQQRAPKSCGVSDPPSRFLFPSHNTRPWNASLFSSHTIPLSCPGLYDGLILHLIYVFVLRNVVSHHQEITPHCSTSIVVREQLEVRMNISCSSSFFPVPISCSLLRAVCAPVWNYSPSQQQPPWHPLSGYSIELIPFILYPHTALGLTWHSLSDWCRLYSM